ncbi:glycosyltransferase family 2 protein [Geodermatophilus sp. URMC 63]
MTPGPRVSDTPVISVVIPARAVAATLGQQVEAVLRQCVDVPFELVISVNGPDDGTRAVAESYTRAHANVVVADCGLADGINRARNVGVHAARGSLVALCDADDVVQPGWLAAILRAHREGADLIGGALLRVSSASDRPGRFTVPAEEDNLHFLPWAVGANCAFTRALYDEVGGFDESFRGGGDDADFCWRAQLRGHRLHSVPDAVVLYSERSSLRELWAQHLKYGESQVALYQKFSAHGMRRSSAARAVGRVVRAAVVLGWVRRGEPLQRRWAVGALAVGLGRFRASLRRRVLYP